MGTIKQYYQRYAFPVTLDIKPAHEVNIVALNAANPDTMNIDYHSEGYDVIMYFFFTGKKWIFTIKNDNNKVDVSKIAAVYQGSGTQNTATFTAKYLSEVLNNHDIH